MAASGAPQGASRQGRATVLLFVAASVAMAAGGTLRLAGIGGAEVMWAAGYLSLLD